MKLFESKREKVEPKNPLMKNALSTEDMLFVRGGLGEDSGGLILE